MIFPSSDEATEGMHPGEESFDLPSSSIAAQFTSVLRDLFSSSPVGCDHLDAVLSGKLPIERVRVVGLVSDELFGEFVKEASGQNVFHKLALGRRSAFDRYGERKTVASGDSDDLGALAAAGGPDGKAPFLALAKVASTNASSKFSLPCACRCAASSFKACSSLPLRIQFWNRRWQVWNGGYFSGSSRHCAPVPRTHNKPLRTARVSCHGRPRLSPRTTGRNTGSTIAHCSSFSSQRPAISAFGVAQSISRMPPINASDVYETGSRATDSQTSVKFEFRIVITTHMEMVGGHSSIPRFFRNFSYGEKLA